MSSSKIGGRIVLSSSGDRWIATISSEIPAWQRQSLGLWFGAWMALGAMLCTVSSPFQVLNAPSTSSVLAFGPSSPSVHGRLSDGTQRHGGDSTEPTAWSSDGPWHNKGAHSAPLSTLDEAVVPEPNPRSFLESMEQQFWVVGGDRITFSANGKTYVFGKQLDPHDAQQLAKAFNQRVKKLSQ